MPAEPHLCEPTPAIEHRPTDNVTMVSKVIWRIPPSYSEDFHNFGHTFLDSDI